MIKVYKESWQLDFQFEIRRIIFLIFQNKWKSVFWFMRVWQKTDSKSPNGNAKLSRIGSYSYSIFQFLFLNVKNSVVSHFKLTYRRL